MKAKHIKSNKLDKVGRIQQLLSSGNFNDAVDIARKELTRNKHNANLLLLYAISLTGIGEFKESKNIFKKYFTLTSGNYISLYNYGCILMRLDELEEAANVFKRTILLNSQDNMSYHNLGYIYNNLFNLTQDVAYIEKSIENYSKSNLLNPNYLACYNLALSFYWKEDIASAISYLDESISLKKDFVEPWVLLAKCYISLNDLPKYYGAIHNGIQIDNNHIELNFLLYDYYKSIQAFPYAEKALTYMAKNLDLSLAQRKVVNVSLLSTYIMSKNYVAAQELYLTAFDGVCENDPEMAENEFVLNAIHTYLSRTCSWNDDYQKFIKRITKKIDKMDSTHVFNFDGYLMSTECNDQELILNLAKRTCDEILNSNNSKIDKFTYKIKQKNTKISIGYLSSDFYDHATVHLLEGVFRNHDRNNFDIHFFGINSKLMYKAEETVQRLSSYGTYHDLTILNDGDAARHINECGIDILVDLKGFTQGNRLQILAHKPAPVQVAYLGYPGTSGASFIDYIITDRIVTPPSDQKFYSEKFAYLPHCYQSTDNEEKISSEVYSKSAFGIDDDAFVFASFNGLQKLTPRLFDTWVEILRKVPNSVLMILVDNKNITAQKNISSILTANGILQNRLVFVNTIEKDRHLARIRDIVNLGLDSTLYNGHTTSHDILWSGKPVLTVKGDRFLNKVSESILTACGLTELVAHTIIDYSYLAIELATDKKKYSHILNKVQAARVSSPYFNTKQFTIDLEKLYQSITSSSPVNG